MAIDRLSSSDTVVGGDQLAISKTSAGDDRRIPVSLLLEYMQDNLVQGSFKQDSVIQYAVPSASGFNVPINDTSDNAWLVLTPTAGYAAGTITLPSIGNVVNKQEVLVNCTQQITTLTIDKNGATAVTGAPLSMGADDFFTLKFENSTNTWYRVG
jgi:hypothetical protein